MLETYFQSPLTLSRLRSGIAGPHLDSFARWFGHRGYSTQIARRHIRAAARFASWAGDNGLAIKNLDAGALDAFGKHLAASGRLRQRNGNYSRLFVGARNFVNFLIGEIPPTDESTRSAATATDPALLRDFARWMRNHRGTAESTLRGYRLVILDLLDNLGTNPKRFDAKRLREFVLDRAGRHGIGHAKTLVTSVRMFLRFLIAIGKCPPGLEHAIPTVAQWRLASLPKYLSSEDVERIIAACDVSTPLGARDRAVILLLVRLGLRAGDVANLRLNDIDWKQGTFLVDGKSRRETRLPLPADVADAIVHYLEKVRPQVDSDYVFITTMAPLTAVSTSTISNTARRAIERAKVDAPSFGAHVFRHSAATEMLRQGATLQTIGAVLRHTSIETTAHYAKVDTRLLGQLAMPWPEVATC